MNARHTIALWLFALGAVTGLLGGIGISAVAADDPGWWLTLFAGIGLFSLGVWLYRRSDHKMVEMKHPDGTVGSQTFPLLAPTRLVLFGVLTACAILSWSGWSDDARSEALEDPKVWKVIGLWVLFATFVLIEVGRRVLRRKRTASKGGSEQSPDDLTHA